MPVSVSLIRKISEVEPPLREVLLSILEEIEKQRSQMGDQVTKTEFNELKEIVRDLSNHVKELAEAQKRSEERLSRLEQVVAELAEAQKRTEERLNELAEAQKRTEERLSRLEQVVAELAEAQKRTEERLNELAEAQKRTEERLSRLEQVVAELAEAQKRTEERLNELAEAQKRSEERLSRLEQVVAELAEAQKRTEERLNELAEAQKRTEHEIAKLARGLQRTRRELGGLSRTVAYALENEAYRHLPSFLKEKLGLEVSEKIIRTYVADEEINIFAKARQNGKEVLLVGEAVLKLDDPAKLKQLWKKIEIVKEEIGGEVVPIIVTHFAKPNVLERAKKAGIIVVQSFEWI